MNSMGVPGGLLRRITGSNGRAAEARPTKGIRRVLVVDDDDSILTLICSILKLINCDVMTARNGLEAVAMFRSCPDLIDLVITDLEMPVLNGYETVRRIRETRAETKIVCMSGYAEKRCPAGTIFLAKPFTPGQVRACIDPLSEAEG